MASKTYHRTHFCNLDFENVFEFVLKIKPKNEVNIFRIFYDILMYAISNILFN